MNAAPRPLDGLSLLDQLRPPSGYRTTWVFGTTYSLDLVACVAALVALDGRARDTSGFNLPSALRALTNLRQRVRIFAQQGCIHPSPKSNPRVLALLDSVVRPIPFDLSKRTFHPKVWVVRQDPLSAEQEGLARFLFIVGSRNLTHDTSWDLGIAVEGEPGKATNIEGVRGFVEHVCQLGDERRFAAEQLSALDAVQWTGWPKGVKTLRFAWHGGDRRSRSTEEGHPLGLPVGQKLLVLTPFLDSSPVSQLAKKWAHVPNEQKLLLSGLDDLRRVSDAASADLRSLGAAWMGVSRDEPADAQPEDAAQPSFDEGDADLLEPDRGLHAKVIAVWTGRKATVMLGSANLTNRAWNAHNCEAWMIAEGGSDIADALWSWAESRANPFDENGHASPPEEAEAVALDEIHHIVSARTFRLDEPEGGQPVLHCEPALAQADLGGLTLHVARLSTPDRATRWKGALTTRLPECEASERTRFLLVRLEGATRIKTWIQSIDVTPAIQSDRDAAALRRLLTPDQLLRYLWMCLDNQAGDGGEEQEEEEAAVDSPERSGLGGRSRERPLRLEALLHAISRARKADQKHVLRDLDNVMRDYRAGSKSAPSQRLDELFVAWDAIREVMLP